MSPVITANLKDTCLTCKVRKKKCSREQPICTDCKRLNKNCVWATETMSVKEIRELREQVELEEKAHRERRRVAVQTDKITKSKGKPIDSCGMNILSAGSFNVLEFKITTSANGQKRSGKKKNTNTNRKSITSIIDTNKGDNESSSNPNDGLLKNDNTPYLNPSSPLKDSYTSPEGSIGENSSTKGTLPDNKENRPNLISQEVSLRSRSVSPFAQFSLDESNTVESVLSISPKLQNLYPILSYHNFDLDSKGSQCFDYYRNHLSKLVSIVPPESNFYVNLFLPLAAINKGILYGLLSWSAAHMGEEYEDESEKYMELALSNKNETSIDSESGAVQRLAYCLILVARELCKGDVARWGQYLRWGTKVIEEYGGLFEFNHDKDRHWLISNYIYHDSLRSSVTENGTYFPVNQYETFMVNQLGLILDPLQGIVRPLFNIIAEVSSLASEVRMLSQRASSEGKNLVLLEMMQKAKHLETKIDLLTPNAGDLRSFSLKELELQLTLFELFQYTAKLHLRQSVLKLNPSSLETQYIVGEFLNSLSVVAGSSVEAALCFPLFIAGMNCYSQKDRDIIMDKFNGLIERAHFKNIVKAKYITMKVWELDPNGSNCIDWYDIIKKLDWDLCFA